MIRQTLLADYLTDGRAENLDSLLGSFNRFFLPCVGSFAPVMSLSRTAVSATTATTMPVIPL